MLPKCLRPLIQVHPQTERAAGRNKTARFRFEAGEAIREIGKFPLNVGQSIREGFVIPVWRGLLRWSAILCGGKKFSK
jgi:hypothetical protein